jgi:AcrR family transcriptional regulator
MPATAKSEPRWTRRKHARPEEITAAALESFVERGYAATRLEDVAARAGISKGTLYLYFANKEELFKAVVREALVARLVEFKSQIGKFQGSSADLLRLVFKTWWERIGSTRILTPPIVISTGFTSAARIRKMEGAWGWRASQPRAPAPLCTGSSARGPSSDTAACT